MAVISVTSGQTSSGLVASNSSASIIVLSGGTTVSSTLAAGGSLIVSSGGHASTTTISSGGFELVSAGGTVVSTTLLSGGTLELLNGSTDTSLNWSGGILEVGSGLTLRTTVSSGNTLAVMSGGRASGSTINSGGSLIVSSGGSASATTVRAGGSSVVLGVDIAATISGSETVSSGGIASATTIKSGGTVTVLSGGTTSGAVISKGGVEIVSSGGTAVGATLLTSGVLDLLGGSTDTGLNWSGGTLEVGSGLTLSTVVTSGNTLAVLSGGTASGVTISSGGRETVLGIDRSATVLAGGSATVSSGGAMSASVISSGGFELVSSGGTVVGTTLLSGGALELLGGSTDTGLNWSGGILEVGSGLTLSTVVTSGNTLAVLSSGTTSGVTISSGGALVVSASGVASATIISSGGRETILGIDRGMTVFAGGSATVSSGGAASGSTIGAGGSLIVLSGGKASTTVISSGGFELVSSGGTAVSATLLSGGILELLSGSTDTTLKWSGGTLEVGAGLTLKTTVSAGDTLAVLSGGIASASTVSSGGVLIVSSGGIASATTISSGGSETVFGTDIGAAVSAGASLSVGAGGVANNPLIKGGILDVMAGGAIGGPVTFTGTGGELQIAGLAMPGNTVSGFASGDSIDLTSVAFDSVGSAVLVNSGGVSNQLQITEGGVTYDLQLDPSQNFVADFFQLASDGAGGSLVTENSVACYRCGTRVRTENGEVPIEQLTIGDRLQTLSDRARAVKWIGRRAYAASVVAGNRALMPVQIAAGAIADGLPARDLWVSPEHALYIEGNLVPAHHLINHVSITQPETLGAVDYFHIEFDSHDLIFAEGMAAESFVDDGNRGIFNNASDYHERYPGAARDRPVYCAPRLDDGHELEVLRRRLLGRGRRLGPNGIARPSRLRGKVELVTGDLIEGWAFDPASPDLALTVVILDNGTEIARLPADRYRRDLEQAGIGDGHHSFSFAAAGALTSDARHQIEIYEESDWVPLSGSPVLLEPVNSEQAQPVIALGALRGNLEHASHHRIAGWVADAADLDRPVGIVAIVNGEIIGRALANRYRADLETAGHGNGRHGFEFVIANPLSPFEAQEIRIQRDADGGELPGSPALLPKVGEFDDRLEASVAAVLENLSATHQEERALAFLTRQTEQLLARHAKREGRHAQREAYRVHLRRWGPAAGDMAELGSGAGGLRALVIDDRIPCPTRDAGSKAILSHMRALQELDYEVSFVAANEIRGGGTAELLAVAGITPCCTPFYTCVEDVLARQAGTFDLVYLHRVANAERYLLLARRYCPEARIVFSVADLHHLRLERQARIEDRSDLLALSRSTAVEEILAARRADLVITHSEVEAEILRRNVGPAKVWVVPYAVQPGEPRRPFSERHGIAFLGSHGHPPNPDAVHYLVNEVLPLVWQREPSLTCTVIGHGWRPELLPAVDKRVTVAGSVDDLGSVFDKLRLTVAPLRFGAGIKGKVLDSFAQGLPCVMTPVAAEGLPLTAALHALVGDAAANLAERIVHYHSDQHASDAAVAEASRMIGNAFSAVAVREALQDALVSKPASRRDVA